MATYFLRARHVSRGKGARVTRAAAYRAGERIRDERTSEVYDYSDRRDVAHKEVVLPAELAGRPDMAWTQDRSTLWNAAEHAGQRRNSRLAREWLVFVPLELTPDQRIRLVRTFAAGLADKYRCAVDVSIHEPRPGADPRNHHAHLLMTTREVTPDGFGPRTALEMGGRERHLLGLAPSRDEYLLIRERWAHVTNEALQGAGLAARVDHRSLEQQGIGREPTPTIPEKVFYAERKSQGRSVAGDAIRARHRERVEARLKEGGELARVLQRQRADLRQRAMEDVNRREVQPQRIRWSALTRLERNALRRERYQVRRGIEKRDPVREAQIREAARLRYHAKRKQDPEAAREQKRQWRQAHAEEVNRKQREYRKTHAQELNLKRREYRKVHAQESRLEQREVRGAHVEGMSRNQHDRQPAPRAQRPPFPTSPSAQESATLWKAYRDTHGPGVTAEESARNWLAFREGQALPGPSHPAMTRTHDEGLEPASADDDAGGNSHRSRDHDLGL